MSEHVRMEAAKREAMRRMTTTGVEQVVVRARGHWDLFEIYLEGQVPAATEVVFETRHHACSRRPR